MAVMAVLPPLHAVVWDEHRSLKDRAVCLRRRSEMAEYQRLAVNINEESADILRTVTKERGITTTEAIRRAIGLLGFFEEARRRETDVYTEDKDKNRARVQIV
jgi:hypothetical protein